QDPALVDPLVQELRAMGKALNSASWRGAGPRKEPPDPFGTIDAVGRWYSRGKMPEPAVYPSPIADACFEQIRRALTARPPRPVLLVGEPGVGKTALARRVAASLNRDGWIVCEASAAQVNAGMSLVGAL